MKYQPSKSFVLLLTGLLPLLAALVSGLLPELKALSKPPVRGEIAFTSARPDFTTLQTRSKDENEELSARPFGGSIDWFEANWEKLMLWEGNPWKAKPFGFGERYMRLASSEDPKDRARARELRRLGEATYKRLLERYPELAVASKQVPPERNGFLKWLEFSERFDTDPGRPGIAGSKPLEMPQEIKNLLDARTEWNSAAVRNWLEQEKETLAEIRAIGLLPEQSCEGIDVNRFAFFNARLTKTSTDALLLDARVAAEEGDPVRAMESVAAANGIANHLANIETPTLLAATVQILVQLSVRNHALSSVIPALPPGSFEPSAWEKTLAPTIHPPAEFARLMRGEWNVTVREYLLPMLMDHEDPKYPPDPMALLDFHASNFLKIVQDHEGRSLPELPGIPQPSIHADDRHLSRSSRQLMGNLWVGANAWRNGWVRSISASAMNEAAFAILKGEPVPLDPVHGQPYRWDPATRTLSAPEGAEFAELDLNPIVVPKP